MTRREPAVGLSRVFYSSVRLVPLPAVTRGWAKIRRAIETLLFGLKKRFAISASVGILFRYAQIIVHISEI